MNIDEEGHHKVRRRGSKVQKQRMTFVNRVLPPTVTLETLRWEMQPLAVESQHCRFYADTARFPAGSIAFDSALLMRGLPHEWHEITDIPELAAKLTAT